MTDPEYLTTRQVATALNVRPRTVRRYCRDGLLPGAVKGSGIWFVPKAAIEVFFQWVKDGQSDGGPTPPTEGTP